MRRRVSRSSKNCGQGNAGAEDRRGDGSRLDGKGDVFPPLSSARCLTRTFVLDHAVDSFEHGPEQGKFVELLFGVHDLKLEGNRVDPFGGGGALLAVAEVLHADPLAGSVTSWTMAT